LAESDKNRIETREMRKFVGKSVKGKTEEKLKEKEGRKALYITIIIS
jgi:hypothetical protein